MVIVPDSIFREYDIRGYVDKDFTEEIIEEIGKAYGTKIHGTIAVGMDARPSSERFKAALIKGLLVTGAKVIDVSLVTTPMLYFAIHHFKTDGGVMITGSHNPREFNGLKLCRGLLSLHGPEIQELKEIIKKEEYKLGKKGSMRKESIEDDYIQFIKERIQIKKPLKIVFDPGNGTASKIGPKLFKELGIEVVELYCEIDGNFPHHLPDPTVVEYVQDLIKKVKEEKADAGIGVDGDADRVGVVDEKGEILWGDKLLILYAREILKRNPKAKVVFDVKCSQLLPEDVEKHDGIAIMWKTGHSLTKAKMHEEKALLAGELSGHIYFADRYLGFDDALYASCRFLEILSSTDKKASELLTDLPKMYSTPEIRLDCPEEKKFQIVEELKKDFKNEFDVIEIDGARIQFGDGWGLVRASNTQPVLVLRFEAKTKRRLEEIKKIVEERINAFL